MRLTPLIHHCCDLLKTETVRDFDAEFDPFSSRRKVEEAIVPERSSHLVEFVRYGSLFELATEWKRFDCEPSSSRLIVVLLLSAGFKAHLPDLIQRRSPAQRLFITSETGRWSGLVSLGDLVLHSSALGWQEISFYRNPEEAISDALQSAQQEERRILFCPEELEMAERLSEIWLTSSAGRYGM